MNGTSLKRISLILGIILGGAAIVGVVYRGSVWTENVQTKTEARTIHEKLRASDRQIDEKTTTTAAEVRTVGRDVRVIKCLMLATSHRAREKCMLDD